MYDNIETSDSLYDHIHPILKTSDESEINTPALVKTGVNETNDDLSLSANQKDMDKTSNNDLSDLSKNHENLEKDIVSLPEYNVKTIVNWEINRNASKLNKLLNKKEWNESIHRKINN